MSFIIPRRFTPGIIRPTNFSRRWPSGYALGFWNLGLIKKSPV